MRPSRRDLLVRGTSSFEPFGRDFNEGTPQSAAGVFLRLPGQVVDASWEDASLGASLFYNVHRWYEPGTGRYTRPDPLTVEIAERALYLRGVPDATYGYVNSLPTALIDRLGLAVQICQRPNEIPEFQKIPVLRNLPHQWIKTPQGEVGLGEAGGRVPGDESPGCRCVGTEIVDHTGESDKPGATCRDVPLVDEDCVNQRLRIGTPRGNWFPIVNDCWTFVDAVIADCRRNPGRPGYRQSPL